MAAAAATASAAEPINYLDEYLERIQFPGWARGDAPPPPTAEVRANGGPRRTHDSAQIDAAAACLQTLRLLHRCHCLAVPFENLSFIHHSMKAAARPVVSWEQEGREGAAHRRRQLQNPGSEPAHTGRPHTPMHDALALSAAAAASASAHCMLACAQDVASLHQRIVRNGRGGMCQEMNGAVGTQAFQCV